MAERRRIVPDNSVIRPAFFAEKIDYHGSKFDLQRRARPLLAAIQSKSVLAYAPDLLLHEFTSTIRDRVWRNAASEASGRNEVDEQVEAFFRLPIIYVLSMKLAENAWEYMTRFEISPPDSWYLACAVYHDAEFWISHEHQDHLVEKARKVHDRVRVLTEDTFDDSR